jgi:hypothetical protein
VNDSAIISRHRLLFSRFADNRRRKADNKKICILRQ